MAEYGIPYMGSKGSLIHKIAGIFPKAENFYDLFGGGFSVSHFMFLHHRKKYNKFFYNEIKSDIVQLVKDAIYGKYNYNIFKPEWISKEKFNKEKDHNAYIRLIWSFGNNQKNYLFSDENERNKRSLHQAVVFNEFDLFAKQTLKIDSFPDHLSIRGRRLACRSIVVRRKGELERLERLQQLQRLQRLQQLEQLQRLQQLELTSMSYDQVKILPNSVIYCDPPYKDTASYLSSFDHKVFWEWVRVNPNPVLVSEYQAPPDIKVIAAFNKKQRLSISRSNTVEKLFGNEAASRSING